VSSGSTTSQPRYTPAGIPQLRGDMGETNMLMTLAFILIALWLLGVASSYTMGGIIHILLVIAIVVFLLRVIQGRRVV
jgi:hypothetical protein